MHVTTIHANNLFDSNSYLLSVDGGYVLVDTGVARRRQALVEALGCAGCEPGDLSLVVITHAHSDHTGNCAFVQKAYGAPLAMHAGDLGKAEHGDMFWRAAGTTPAMKIAKALTGVLGIAGFDPFVPDVLLTEGRNLAEWGLAATVHHLPGHSQGSICLLTEKGDFFCGDLLTNTRGGPARNSIIDVRRDYDASIRRLHELPITTVYPGHGEPFALAELFERRRRRAPGENGALRRRQRES